MTTTSGAKQTTNGSAWAQKLVLYHPSGAGNGAALQLEPRVNRKDADRYNCFFLEMAPQKTAAGRQGDQKVPATFDWEHKLTVKLEFSDICELLAVLEGRSEKAGGARNGLYHQNGQASTVITLQKNVEKGGYFIGLSKKELSGSQPVRVHMLLGEAEAIGLRCIFQSALFLVTFHTHLFGGPRDGSRKEAAA